MPDEVADAVMGAALGGSLLSSHAEPLDPDGWEGAAQWSTEDVYGHAWAIQGRLESGAAVKVSVPTRADLERLLGALDGVPKRALRRLFIVPSSGLRVG